MNPNTFYYSDLMFLLAKPKENFHLLHDILTSLGISDATAMLILISDKLLPHIAPGIADFILYHDKISPSSHDRKDVHIRIAHALNNYKDTP